MEHVRLLQNVPLRHGKGKGGGKRCHKEKGCKPTATMMRDDASWHMKGMMAKYTLEFRRPFPELRNATRLDRWTFVPLAVLNAKLEAHEGFPAKLKAVTGDAFQVPDRDIECTHEKKHLGVLRERFATSLFVSL